jgi:hypothetical protein
MGLFRNWTIALFAMTSLAPAPSSQPAYHYLSDVVSGRNSVPKSPVASSPMMTFECGCGP